MPTLLPVPCRINLPTLVIEPDRATADMILSALAEAGIPDADLVGSAEDAKPKLSQRDYSTVIASESQTQALLAGEDESDEESDGPGFALVIVAESTGSPAPGPGPALAVLPRSSIGTHLVSRIQAALGQAGLRCKSHHFCTRSRCQAGF